MNRVILIGRLTKEPEIRYTQSGKPVASYTIAVDRPFKVEGQPTADFPNCVAWNANAEFVQKYLHKGTKIAIEGRLQTRSYKNNDDNMVYVTEIIVDRHEFCESKKNDYSGVNVDPGLHEIGDEDGELPF